MMMIIIIIVVFWQSMQSAIQQQVTKLGAGSSHKRVGLVAFNNNVSQY